MEMLRMALFADTETTSLSRGAGIHELAIYDQETRRVLSYIVDPNFVVAHTTGPQDELRMTTGPQDRHVRAQVGDWLDVIKRELGTRGVVVRDGDNVVELLRQHHPWLYDQLQSGAYPHLAGNLEPLEQLLARSHAFARAGIAFSQQRVGITDAIQGLASAMKPGSTLWIANAAFESKQIGAQIAAEGELGEYLRTQLITGMQTQPRGSDVLYVTGAKVNEAIVLARITGDWTHVYEAYRRYTPAAGETAVRDILHVVRGMFSYADKLGLRKGGEVAGVGVDLMSQVFARVDNLDLAREAHRAGEDAAIHSPYVLRRAAEFSEAARQVLANTDRGRELRAQAQAGSGVLADFARAMAIHEELQSDLARKSAIQRLARARREMIEHGYATGQTGVAKIFKEEKLDAQGNVVLEPRVTYSHERYYSMEDVQRRIAGEYGEDLVKPLASEAAQLGTLVDVTAWEHQGVKAAEAAMYQSQAWNAQADAVRLRRAGSKLPEIFQGLKVGRNMMIAGGVAVGLGILGSLGSPTVAPPPSIVSYNYRDWLARQEQQDLEGMRHDGPVGAQRAYATDFGSPYQGPTTSMIVLADQELVRERRRQIHAQYGSSNGVSPSQLLRGQQGYSFVQGTRALEPGERPGLRGDGLRVLQVDPTQYDLVMSDADTVTLQRKGMLGKLRSWMGDSYSFRLEGIDSPEVAHPGAYKAPQPGAELAKAAAQAMTQGKPIELVINPHDSTYGRQLAVMFVNGKNYNIEAVRAGYAAFLPYGKQENSMLDWAEFKRAESKAYASQRGIWNNAWARVFYEASAAGAQRPTFNTFTKRERLAANGGTLSLFTTMEAAQAQGWSDGVAEEARLLGQSLRGRGFDDDKFSPYVISYPNAPHRNYAAEQARDLSTFMSTHGNASQPGATLATNKLDRLNSSLAVDTMGTSTNVHTRRSQTAFERYGTKSALARARQAEMQRQANQNVFNTGIGHHRM